MWFRLALLDLIMLFGCVAWCHSGPLQPEDTFDLAQLLPDAVTKESSVSIEFLTDTTLVLCLHADNGRCRLYIFERDKSGLHNLSPEMNIEAESLIHRLGTDRILSTGLVYSESAVYSASLQQRQQIPYVNSYLISPSGRLSASSGTTSWTVYQLVPVVHQLRQGSGMLISVSDETLAIRRGDKIYLEALDGKDLGAFAVKPEVKCLSDAKLLNSSTLFLTDCGRFSISDFTGRRLAKVNPPSGNPHHLGISDAGTRLLFDYGTRHLSPLKHAAELGQIIATAGLGVPDEWDNGEAVRVIDTKTGSICFDWHVSLPASLHTVTGYSHSDLSPTGTFVAIANGTMLSFFRLPDKCTTPRPARAASATTNATTNTVDTAC
jgi:hypothetical protein